MFHRGPVWSLRTAHADRVNPGALGGQAVKGMREWERTVTSWNSGVEETLRRTGCSFMLIGVPSLSAGNAAFRVRRVCQFCRLFAGTDSMCEYIVRRYIQPSACRMPAWCRCKR